MTHVILDNVILLVLPQHRGMGKMTSFGPFQTYISMILGILHNILQI